MRKMLLPSLFLVATSLVVADEPMENVDANELESRVCCLEMRGEGYADKHIKTGSWDCYVTGDWLYWKANEGGTGYAITSPSPIGFSLELQNAHLATVKFETKSGYRLGAGVHLPPGGWDLYFNYTHYDTSQSNSVGDGSLFVFPLGFYNIPAIDAVSFATADWKITYKAWDLCVARETFISKRFSITPHAGVKWAKIDQNETITYSGSPTFPPTIPFPGTLGRSVVAVDNVNNFKGCGISAGMEGDLYIWDGLNLFGNATLAALLGHFKINQNQSFAAPFSPSPTFPIPTIANLNDKEHLMAPMLQLQAGVAWDSNWDCWHFGIQASYEVQYWWSQNRLQNFVSETHPHIAGNSDDLAFQGFTLSGRIDF